MAGQPWLAQLQSAQSPTEKSAALKTLKNQIIGHPPKKAVLVNAGVLEPVVRLSNNSEAIRPHGKGHDPSIGQLSDREIVRLQALHIVASIATGGPSYLPPLHNSAALPAVLSNLCPLNNPPQLVLAALRTLSNYANSTAQLPSTSSSKISSLADSLFTRQHTVSLCRVLSQTSSSSVYQAQINVAASLISRVCHEERHQQSLVNHGVLEALATKLASFIVADGYVIPQAGSLAHMEGLQDYIPQPAQDYSSYTNVLEAIAVIISDSTFRASHLLYSPSILAIFPSITTPELVPSPSTRATWKSFTTAGLNAQQERLNPLDFLLPVVPAHPHKSSSSTASAFPPLGTSSSREQLALNARSNTGKNSNISSLNRPESPNTALERTDVLEDISATDSGEAESPLIAYLVLSLRNRSGLQRLMAASVLTMLYRAGLTNKSREVTIGLLVVPILVQMLDGISASDDGQDSVIAEQTPAILAKLITDSEFLQRAAYDAGIVARLSKMIKVAYNPIPDNFLPRPWLPSNEGQSDDLESAYYARINEDRQSQTLAHNIKVRESTLKAIAALVPFKDEYRKAIVDQGIIPYVVESMNATPGKPIPKTAEKNSPKGVSIPTADTEANRLAYGANPISVLIAACGAIRALSRSVSILRTTLIDNGVAMPVFKLLQHADIEVQIAATATVCNLVTDVSPMRDVVTEAGLLKILCEHTRSMNAKLRLNAVWALKHFVQGVSNDMKRQCLEELGQGWLVQLICDDTEDEALVSSNTKTEKSGIDKVTDEDVEMDHYDDEELSDSRSGILRPISARSKSFQQAELRLAALRDAETNPVKKARKDDIAVQEQGLDFIRNLIGGAGPNGTSDTTEMIDFLFNALGQDRVFEILASKLRPKVINPFNRRNISSTETRLVPPQSEIVTAVAYILVHMAASVPRHRQIVISQTDLLKLLVPLFNHPNIEVRHALCWLITNLTCREDANDGQACIQRARELKSLGVLTKLETLQHDSELNVRERAKTALWQMKQGL